MLIPAVENAISGNAFRPGDILTSRKGITVEIGNTDAEGRLVLADALALADEEKPELLIDMATLTGAARVALGPDLPPFYTHDDRSPPNSSEAAAAASDPLWRMPLWKPYDSKLSSKVADVNNVTTDGFAGSITAALFLNRFVEKTRSWAHFDIFAWSPTERPHCPVGGEAQASARSRASCQAIRADRLPAEAVCRLNETEPKQISAIVLLCQSSCVPARRCVCGSRSALSEVRGKSPDLTMRQAAILLTVYLEPPPHTVRGLAARLGVTKPVITRALDTMGALKLLSRHRDERDKRNVLVKRTVEGALFVERFGDVIIARAQELTI